MTEPTDPGEEANPERPGEPRRKGVSTELRRFLGGPRTLKDRSASERRTSAAAERDRPAGGPQVSDDADERQHSERRPVAVRRKPHEPRPPAPAAASDETEPVRTRGPAIRVDETMTRAVGMQHVALVLGGILLLFCAFYVGSKYQYWRYLLATRNAPEVVTTSVAAKFPDATADELIEQALVAEHSGDWRGAVDRFVAAKHKDRAHRGLLFRAGKLLYDHQAFAVADQVFQNAIELGENIDAANYYRGLIATKNGDMAAADRFLAAATAAEPLIGYYHYSWAEALRLGRRPKEAIRKYEQAILRTPNEHTRSVYRFKIRLAEIEAGEISKVRAAVNEKQAAGAQPVDWLLTAAALNVYHGEIPDALRIIAEAGDAKHPGLFADCVRDMFFQSAAKKHPALAPAVRLDFDPNLPAFPR